MNDKVITGSWDGLPIWRWKTSGERLAEELENEMLKREDSKNDAL